MKFYSQAGQDAWVYEHLGRGGFFVDVGAHDGVIHSNTYALELAGWTGVCIEPDPEPFADLLRNRTTVCLDVAVSNDDEDVTIRPSGLTRRARTLDWVLARYGPIDRIVDYLSIDTEGHELQVLAGLDFNEWHVGMITIEHNSYLNGPWLKDEIAAVLEANDFTCVNDAVVAPGYGEYESWWSHSVAEGLSPLGVDVVAP